ncbi:MAG: acyl-CoA dehydratase activase [Dehalococcoidales bacterium]|jgi:predicted CoA-substrate-specific enzyme activase
MTLYAGLDAGSRTVKLVLYDGAVREAVVVPTGVNPLQRCKELLADKKFDALVVTGYGRHLVAPVLGGRIVSEIKAFAVGSRHLVPECHTVIDIGGQDCKVILLSDNGDVHKFEMNDRCAAGTGKFLEIMADTLEMDIADIGGLALKATKVIRINSLCTVFAESEVVSLIAKGEETSTIALALHAAITERIAAMVKRTGVREKVVFAGGGSYNRCLKQLLEKALGTELTVPASPQTAGALGAALLAVTL